MLAWPHGGFRVHDAVWVPDGDGEFAKRLARYCARNPVALERLQYDGAPTPVPVAAPEPLPLREARRRWAGLLRRLYEVDPLTCPACGGAMRILAFITEAAVIDRILAHLRRSARGRGRGRTPNTAVNRSRFVAIRRSVIVPSSAWIAS